MPQTDVVYLDFMKLCSSQWATLQTPWQTLVLDESLYTKGKERILLTLIANVLSKLFQSLALTRMLPELEMKGSPQFSKQLTSVVCHMWGCYLRRIWNPFPSCTEREHHLPDFLRFGESFWHRWVLHPIKASGIHGKCWRIIQSFHDRPKGHVKVMAAYRQVF